MNRLEPIQLHNEPLLNWPSRKDNAFKAPRGLAWKRSEDSLRRLANADAHDGVVGVVVDVVVEEDVLDAIVIQRQPDWLAWFISLRPISLKSRTHRKLKDLCP